MLFPATGLPDEEKILLEEDLDGVVQVQEDDRDPGDDVEDLEGCPQPSADHDAPHEVEGQELDHEVVHGGKDDPGKESGNSVSDP